MDDILVKQAPNIFHFKRSRLFKQFAEAVNFPVVLVCAGAGYGKTTAVHDFVYEHNKTTAWMQLSERDNTPARFWENFIHSISLVNMPFVNAASKMGFPDTEDKYRNFLILFKKYLSSFERRILVMDDLHVLEDKSVLRFIELAIQNLSPGSSLIIISRSTPLINIASHVSRGHLYNISEEDLCFTENEVSQYLGQLKLSPPVGCLKEIMQDTGGWAFALNLIARYYQRAPAYEGYLRSAMKSNIFRLMETEVWDGITEPVQNFFVRLSLIEHLSFDLIDLIAKGDRELITDAERQNAYLRRDNYINAYVIHHLFLEFLATKQDGLSEEEKYNTYFAAGEWCNKNGFKIDALSYYEKIGDYKTIISIIYAMPYQLPYDVAQYCMEILDRAPPSAYDTVLYLSITHIRCSMRMGEWHKAKELAGHYEQRLLKLPEDNQFRTASLAGLYLILSYLRNFLCLSDNIFDFDSYMEKFSHSKESIAALSTHSSRIRVLGPWANANGSSAAGMPEEYIKAVSRASSYMPEAFSGFMGGEEELVKGELKFFQGELNEAEALLKQAAEKSRKCRQYEIFHRTQIYLMRLSVAQGNFEKAEQANNEQKSLLCEEDYSNRYVNYDIAFAIYCFVTGSLDSVPEWIKRDFSSYRHASFIENLENQVKTRYFYRTRNFPPLLAYIEEMRQRESFLYGRISLLALEACVYYQMKDKKRAHASLTEAYNEAAPNGLIMSFIELGKDMRTLASSLLKEQDSAAVAMPAGAGDAAHADGVPATSVPAAWLEKVSRKAASYAKRQATVMEEYRRHNRLSESVILSPREMEVLKDLSHGLSRAEIAVNRNLSINTVKMVINNIYCKLGAENVADLVRIAMERKII